MKSNNKLGGPHVLCWIAMGIVAAWFVDPSERAAQAQSSDVDVPQAVLNLLTSFITSR